jgi:hypothetical protein
MWETQTAEDFVLADLCARCASDAGRLLDIHGGRGRASMRVLEPVKGEATAPPLMRRASGVLVRAALYILIALATFFVVTLLTSRG